LAERIRIVRDLYIQEIRIAQALETESHEIFQQNKTHINNLVNLNTEQIKKKKELKVQEELKNKLQEMCRLLQKQAKEIVEDSERQRELEQVRMSDLTSSFTETINGISKKIAEQEELFVKQAEENNQLRSKLMEFQEHTKLRDSHFKSQLHAKDLELQLIEARRTQEVSFSFLPLTFSP
jgi:single-stranded DNA-specific DHH superfamily exonuclease